MKKIKSILNRIKRAIHTTPRYALVALCLVLVLTSSGLVVWRKVRDGRTPECNTAIIRINGQVVAYKSAGPDTWMDETVTSDILGYLDAVESDPSIKAIVLQINSGGGSPAGGQSIANALKRMTDKETVAMIEEQGTSTAYLIATGTDRIFASDLSSIGSIGVIQEAYDQVEKDRSEGYNFSILTSAPYKASGNVHQPLTQEDKDSITAGLMAMHRIFVNDVATNRHLDADYVAQLADGSSMSGTDGVSTGLIDQVGDMYDVKAYLAEKLNEPITTCGY